MHANFISQLLPKHVAAAESSNVGPSSDHTASTQTEVSGSSARKASDATEKSVELDNDHLSPTQQQQQQPARKPKHSPEEFFNQCESHTRKRGDSLQDRASLVL
jgi:hypothetical protein